MVDADLAPQYGMPTEALDQVAKRNATRFPQDFIFQLSPGEFTDLRSQIVTSSLASASHGGQRHQAEEGRVGAPPTVVGLCVGVCLATNDTSHLDYLRLSFCSSRGRTSAQTSDWYLMASANPALMDWFKSTSLCSISAQLSLLIPRPIRLTARS